MDSSRSYDSFNVLLLIKQLSPRTLNIARATCLLRAFILWWMVRHGLNTKPSGTGKTVKDNRGSGHQTADSPKNTASAL